VLALGAFLSLVAACGTSTPGAVKDGSNDRDGLAEVDAPLDTSGFGSDVGTDIDDGSSDRDGLAEVDALHDTAVFGSDVGADVAACLFPVDVGCFTGAVCASPQVHAVCVDGAWRCPAGSQSTEFCQSPDGGVDTSAAP